MIETKKKNNNFKCLDVLLKFQKYFIKTNEMIFGNQFF